MNKRIENCYMINFNNKKDEANLKGLKSIIDLLKRTAIKGNFLFIAYACLSCYDGSLTQFVLKKTGKPGRPKRVAVRANKQFKGSFKVKPHYHVLVYGEGAATLCGNFCKAYNRKENKYATIQKSRLLKYFYLRDQAKNYRTVKNDPMGKYDDFDWNTSAFKDNDLEIKEFRDSIKRAYKKDDFETNI